MRPTFVPAVLLALSQPLWAGAPFTFTGKGTTEAVKDYTSCMITAAEVHPYSLPQDIDWRCSERLEGVRHAATLENASRPHTGRLRAIDDFVSSTKKRVVSQVLAE